MTKITVTRMIEKEEELEVDDRIYDEDSMAYRIANVIMEGRLKRNIDNIYRDDYNVVVDAIERINYAFATADKILELKNDN